MCLWFSMLFRPKMRAELCQRGNSRNGCGSVCHRFAQNIFYIGNVVGIFNREFLFLKRLQFGYNFAAVLFQVTSSLFFLLTGTRLGNLAKVVVKRVVFVRARKGVHPHFQVNAGVFLCNVGDGKVVEVNPCESVSAFPTNG